VGGRRKRCRGERKARRRREKVTVAALPLVRGWVDGNDGDKSDCGGRGGGGGRWQCWLLVRRKKEKDAEEENLQRKEGRPRGSCAYRR